MLHEYNFVNLNLMFFPKIIAFVISFTIGGILKSIAILQNLKQIELSFILILKENENT